MAYRAFLARKYLFSRSINVLCVIGVGLGVATLIVVIAVMDGFQVQLKSTVRGHLSDLTIYPAGDAGTLDLDRLEAAIREIDDRVVAIAPQVNDFALASLKNGGSRGQVGVAMAGVDPARHPRVGRFRESLHHVRDGVLEPTVRDLDAPFRTGNEDLDRRYPGVIVGRVLAERLGLMWRDGPPFAFRDRIIYLTTAAPEADPEGGGEEIATVSRMFVVTGLYSSGNYEFDSAFVFVDLNAADELTRRRRDSMEILVKAEAGADLDAIQQNLSRHSAELWAAASSAEHPMAPAAFWIDTWLDQRRHFLTALDNEKGMIAIALFLIVLVAGFMIVAILSMLVLQKTRDIGVIKALGGTTNGVLAIFLFNGFAMGAVGAGCGLGLGLLVAQNVNWVNDHLIRGIFGRDVFPPSIYQFERIPALIEWFWPLIVFGSAVTVAFLAALVPALRAAWKDPVEALRYE